MKRLLSVGLLTACALACSEHQAQAWVNAKFSIGLNWHVQSANNNVLWGLWKNGQVPGPEAFGQPGVGPFGPGQMGPGQMPPAGTFPFFGNNPSQPNGTPVAFPGQSMPTAAAPQQGYYPYPMQYYQQQQPQQQQQFQANPYQTVSYQNSGYYYPSTYYPMYQSYYGQAAPYYWYNGR